MPKLSKVLKDLGFSLVRDPGMSIVHSPRVAERMIFCHSRQVGSMKTTAIDENGDRWVKTDEHINLIPHGFKEYSGQEIAH